MPSTEWLLFGGVVIWYTAYRAAQGTIWLLERRRRILAERAEVYIPSAKEDWDADYERLTGKQIPGATANRTTGKYSGLIRGSFNTLLHPGLRKAFPKPEPEEEVFDEALDETVSFHTESKMPDAEW